MTRTRLYFAALLALPGVLSAAGCGSSEQFAPVHGRLTADGKPLDKVLVQFIPDSDQGCLGPRSVGTTDADGFYKLVADDGRAGAVVGPHLVVLTDLTKVDVEAARNPRSPKDTSRAAPPLPQPGEAPPAPPTVRFSAEYSASARTPLKKTVEAGDQTIDLAVPAPPAPPPMNP